MKVPRWAIPGVAAIVLTTASVSAAEGSLGSPRVALPREVQLAAPGAGDRTPPTTPTSLPAVAVPSGNVVAPARPVITQVGPTDPTGDPGNPAYVPSTGGDGASRSPAPADDSGAVPTTLPTPTPTAVAPAPADPTSVSTTTQPVVPPTTTTTTTRPQRGGQHGDE